MNNRGQAPIVRHSYAGDPNPAKVQAALTLWRRALAHRMMYDKTERLKSQGARAEGNRE